MFEQVSSKKYVQDSEVEKDYYTEKKLLHLNETSSQFIWGIIYLLILMINLVFSPKQPLCVILHTTVGPLK